MCLIVGTVIDHPSDIIDTADLGIDREPELAEIREGVRMRPQLGAADQLADLVHPQPQSPPGGDRGILLTQTPRSRIARIREPALTGLFRCSIECFKGGDRQVDLTAHLE